jgi:GntR family galactonate operon transcriptional repressor
MTGFARPEKTNGGWSSTALSVARALGTTIAAGQFKPGDALPIESELAARHGVGRNTIREAIRLLAGKGLITVSPRRGTIVEPRDNWNLLDPEVLEWSLQPGIVPGQFLLDLTELRMIIEPAAAELAARKATAEGIASIRGAIAAMIAADGSSDPDVIVAADIRFHLAVLKAARNEPLAVFAKALVRLLDVNFRLAMEREGAYHHNLGAHIDILEAIVARDTAAARQASLRLLEYNGRVIAELIASRDGKSV